MRRFQPGRQRQSRGKPQLATLVLIAMLATSFPDPGIGLDKPVKIGLLLPPEEPQAADVREGALLAEQQANQAHGQQLALCIRSRVGQWGADAVEVARMVTDEGVDGLIAPPDGAASHLTLQVSGRTAVPVASLCADSSVGRTGVPWMLRVSARTEDEAEALLHAFGPAKTCSTNRWVAFVPDARAGREISEDLRRAARRQNVEFRKIIEWSPTVRSADALGQVGPENEPAAILLWLPPLPAGKLAKELRMAGYRGRLAGPGLLHSTQFMAAAGDALEGFVIPTTLIPGEPGGGWDAFRLSYRQVWHHEPSITAALSYDAATLLAQLLQRPDFEAPPHRLVPGFIYHGASGELTFDSHGNRKVKLTLLRGHKGTFIFEAEPALRD